MSVFFAPVVNRGVPVTDFFDTKFRRFVDRLGLNFEQDEQSWTLTLDMPGVSREELAIDVEGPVVRIGTKAEAKRQYKAAYELSQEIDPARSEAQLKDGVLTLKLGKLQPVSNARSIEVK